MKRNKRLVSAFALATLLSLAPRFARADTLSFVQTPPCCPGGGVIIGDVAQLPLVGGSSFLTQFELDNPYWNGSAATGVFTANEGDVITVHYKYATNESVAGEWAAIIIDQSYQIIARQTDTHQQRPLYPLPFVNTYLPGPDQSLWTFISDERVFQSGGLSAGPHRVTIGVVNIADPTIASAYFGLGYTVAQVPEPSTFLLLGTGIVGLLVIKRRRLARRFRRATP